MNKKQIFNTLYNLLNGYNLEHYNSHNSTKYTFSFVLDDKNSAKVEYDTKINNIVIKDIERV